MDKSLLKGVVLALAAFNSVPDDADLAAREISISNLRDIARTVKQNHDAPKAALANVTRVFGYSERRFCDDSPVHCAHML
jgi:hypothetical protein